MEIQFVDGQVSGIDKVLTQNLLKVGRYSLSSNYFINLIPHKFLYDCIRSDLKMTLKIIHFL